MRKILLFSIIIFKLIFLSSMAKAAPDSFADLVEDLTPSVVNISTTQTIEGIDSQPFGNMFEFNFPGGRGLDDMPDLFKRFYGAPDKNGSDKIERKTSSLGSGFVVSSDGYIVTNHHVVDKADEIKVIFNDDSEYDAKVIGSDPKTDIAVLKIKPKKKLSYVRFGDSDGSRVGDWVIAIGNPFGLGGSVSAGIISARARDINSGPFDDFIQTDAAINRGNSGGPLFNDNGEVIGVNSAIFSPSGGNVGIGFAVPATLAKPVIDQLIEKGFIERGWLGVKIQTVTDEIAESLGIKESMGALVVQVEEGSPADKAGVLTGDIITKFDSKEVETMRKLPRIVAETKVGKKVTIEVLRKGEKKTLLVTIALLDTDNEEQFATNTKDSDSKSTEKDSLKISGIYIKDIEFNDRKKFNLSKNSKGVVITDIDNASKASQKPIRVGDVISSINQTDVNNTKEAEELIKKAKKDGKNSALLLIYRGSNASFITLPLE